MDDSVEKWKERLCGSKQNKKNLVLQKSRQEMVVA